MEQPHWKWTGIWKINVYWNQQVEALASGLQWDHLCLSLLLHLVTFWRLQARWLGHSTSQAVKWMDLGTDPKIYYMEFGHRRPHGHDRNYCRGRWACATVRCCSAMRRAKHKLADGRGVRMRYLCKMVLLPLKNISNDSLQATLTSQISLFAACVNKDHSTASTTLDLPSRHHALFW